MTLFIGFLREIGFHIIETSVLHTLAYTGGKKNNDLQINQTASMFHYTYVHKPKTKCMSVKARICK
jgi:hypothetical protein